MIAQVLSLLGILIIGILLSYWVRIIQLHGLELWLPMGILLTLAISPLAGFLFAAIIIIGSWVIFPFDLRTLVLELFTLGITLYTLSIMPVSSNLVLYSTLVAVLFNILTNIAFLFLGFDPMKALKFAAFSIWLTWLLTSNWGPQLLEFFAL